MHLSENGWQYMFDSCLNHSRCENCCSHCNRPIAICLTLAGQIYTLFYLHTHMYMYNTLVFQEFIQWMAMYNYFAIQNFLLLFICDNYIFILWSNSRIVHVRETRITGIMSHILIGLSMFLLPNPLQLIPKAVLDGLFLYIACTALAHSQMFERIMLLVTEQVG